MAEASMAQSETAQSEAARSDAAANQSPSDDPLAEKVAEAERLKEYIDRTTFAGDLREVADELSVVDQHPADFADVTMQRGVDLAIRDVVEGEVEQVEAAVQRRAEGRYGICDACDRPIGDERLQARPHATLCIDCARKQEQGQL
jgi:RNA polymerase-binding protein DksA